jgi:uncharacterized protein YjbI with pentapeptide repeats
VNINSLRDRWKNTKCKLDEPSPFGLTQDGLMDFRGAEVLWPENSLRPSIRINAKKYDLSHCVFDDVAFNYSTFEDCTLVKSKIEYSHFVGCEFRNCSFVGSRFKGNSTGFSSALFHECKFERAAISRINFELCQFLNCPIHGDTWSHNQFDRTVFKNCIFEGNFDDCRFWGTNPGRPKIPFSQRGAIMDCDLRRASFTLSDMICGFKLSNIQLPEDGSMIIVAGRDVAACKQTFKADSEKFDKFEDLLSVYGGEYQKGGNVVFFYRDLENSFGFELATEFFNLLKAQAIHYDGKNEIVCG